MYVYIYDAYLGGKKYDNLLARIETRITDLGLNGKIIRLDVMRNVEEAIISEIRQGAKTIVAVGNDQTASKVINVIGCDKIINHGIEIVLGIIPIEEKGNRIAMGLGIMSGQNACDILSARRIEKLNLGQAGSNFFISHAFVKSAGTVIEMDKNYSVEIGGAGEINIINFSDLTDLPKNINPDPRDDKLDIYIKTRDKTKINFKQKDSQSFFSLNNFKIFNKKQSLILDDSLIVPAQAEIKIASKKISVIVGKDRSF